MDEKEHHFFNKKYNFSLKSLFITYIFILAIVGCGHYFNLGAYSGVLVILTLILPGVLKNDFGMAWFFKIIERPGSIRSLIFSCALGFFILFLFYFSWNYGASIFNGVLLEFKTSLTNKENSLYYYDLFQMLVFSCVVEEMLFRGFFQESISEIYKNHSRFFACFHQIFWPSIGFALLHCFEQGVMGLIVFFPALVFAIFKFWRNHIIGCIALHFIFNVFYDQLALKPY